MAELVNIEVRIDLCTGSRGLQKHGALEGCLPWYHLWQGHRLTFLRQYYALSWDRPRGLEALELRGIFDELSVRGALLHYNLSYLWLDRLVEASLLG